MSKLAVARSLIGSPASSPSAPGPRRRLRAHRNPGARCWGPRFREGSPTGRDGRGLVHSPGWVRSRRGGQVPACDGRSRPCTTHRGDQCSGAVVRRRWAWSGSTVQPLATSQASAAVRAGSRRGRAGPGAARPGRARGGRPGSRPSPGSRPGARAGPGSGGRVAVHDRVRGAGQGRPGGPAHGHHLGRHPAQVHVAAALRGQQTRVPWPRSGARRPAPPRPGCGSRHPGHRRQCRATVSASMRSPAWRPATGTRSSSPWNMAAKSPSPGSRRTGAKP
jgi:hypothetical protein